MSKKKVLFHPRFGPSHLGWILLIPIITPCIFPGSKALAREFFNPAFLQIGGEGSESSPDLSAFEDSNSQAAGEYRVDIWLNNAFVETRNLYFSRKKDDEGNDTLAPCISLAILKSYGVRTESFPALQEKEGCVNISAIPQAAARFNFNTQRLLLSLPQAALVANARGYVSPDQYDEGIPALLLNYRFSGANNYAQAANTQDSNSQYLNLRPGLNIGPWRLRNYTTWNRDSSGQGSWDNVYTYLQRNIVSLKGQLTLGDSSSPADIFDSVPFRGAQLASDDEMLPESLRGYAPIVRGTARSNAQVVIRQNGYIIYQSYVAPGSFEITDMYATGGSGDLQVTINEADGSSQNFVVPYASLPVLQREGRFKYSITSGQYRSYDGDVDKTSFSQLTGIYGLPFNMTAYGGVQAASKYQSLAFGLGKNFGDFGAFSADVTQAWSKPQDQMKENGQSWRVRYSKNFAETGTNFAIAGYRYSTSDYYSLAEVMDSYRSNQIGYTPYRTRNRTELTLNQNLSDKLGSLSLSLLREDYWRSQQRMESISAGYNNSWNSISYSLNYSYSRNSSNWVGGRSYDKDQVVSFNISVPLERWLSNTWANYTVSSSKPGNTTNSVGIGGTALPDNNLYWNMQQGYTSQGGGNNGHLDGGYRGTYGEVSAGYGYDRNVRRLNYGLEGGVLAHADGITFSQAFGDTAALVAAPGAAGVGVYNQTGVKTDFRGYTVVPNVAPYRRSDMALDTTTLPDDVDLDLTTQSVVPTRGAIVRASFVAQVGSRVMMRLTRNGSPIPFGATVTDPSQQNKQASIVGDDGQVYLNGLAPVGSLLVQWGKDSDKQCRVAYQLPQDGAQGGIKVINGDCH
ncbi:outer membrane usher protein [Serratia fonticola]|uniref:Outer membrane usher protein n=1 Tax=Serratia fonticola TaxID=47917 RepID=A0A542BHV6_SERFO|nr:fimbria/pilus outer membrane usher protein [Serratia fonticola]TQI78152.1 outer membrane usher protein [Serratia fonticola]TQI94850.1 outer membrane usher protein [Serratia fonticola]TVZ69348.1 outer membrane usher protein [Serratia fonticola]